MTLPSKSSVPIVPIVPGATMPIMLVKYGAWTVPVPLSTPVNNR